MEVARKRKGHRGKGRGTTATVRSAEELTVLAERRPLEAARVLSRAQRGQGALRFEANELDRLCTLVAGKLRHLGRFEKARSLLKAPGVRSTAARLEEALSAFAMGDDLTVRALAERMPELAPVLEPMVCAANGDPVPRSPRGSPGTLKSLYSAARAVQGSAAGNKAAVARAVTAIADPDLRRTMRAATRLARGENTSSDLPNLLGLEVPELTRIARIAHAIADPREALHFSDSPEEMHHALWALVGQLGAAAASHVALEEAGPDFFERPADAWLELGFEMLREAHRFGDSNTEEADDHFARALELGADMGECQRGRWIHLRRRLMDSGRPRDFERMRTAATRYGRRLQKDPRHAAVHFALLLDLALAQMSQGKLAKGASDVRALRESVSGTWLDTRGIQAETDAAESQILQAMGDLKQARALAERAVELKPKHRAAWSTLLELTSSEKVPETAARAYAATGDEHFRIPPTLDPGRASLEARLVSEVAEAPSLDVAFPDIASRSAGLSVEARELFDMAALQVLMERDALELAKAHLDARLQGSEPVAQLLLVALHLQLVEPVRAYFGRLDGQSDVAALEKVVCVAKECVSPELAAILLGRLAPWLRTWPLTSLQKRLRGTSTEGSSDTVDALLEHVDAALQPGFALFEYLDSSLLTKVEAEVGPPDMAELEMLFDPLMRMLGMSNNAIPKEQKRQFYETMMSNPTMPDREMQRILSEFAGKPSKPKRRKTKRKKKRR